MHMYIDMMMYDSLMGKHHLSEVERGKIVNLRQQSHLSHQEIAKKVKCDQSTVTRTLARYHYRHTFKEASGRGRKPSLTGKQINHLKNIIHKNKNITSTELATHLHHHDSVNISPRTIQRHRKRIFHRAEEIIIPKVTLDHMIKRMSYTIEHKNDNFRKVVFTDECYFQIDHTGNIVWLLPGESPPLRPVSSIKTKVMVWGGIWYQGRTELHIVKGTIDTNKYIHILKQFLLPSMPSSSAFLFQQDNATPHKPIEVELMLRDYAIELLQDYPPNSPDFNPIERIWSWIYHYIKRKYPTNRVTLIAAIKEAWDALPQKIIKSYIDHLPGQLEHVAAAAGARLD